MTTVRMTPEQHALMVDRMYSEAAHLANKARTDRWREYWIERRDWWGRRQS